MNVLLICNDCATGISAELQELAHQNKKFSIYLSGCMGSCPEKKISTLELDGNKVNSFEIRPLTVTELTDKIKSGR